MTPKVCQISFFGEKFLRVHIPHPLSDVFSKKIFSLMYALMNFDVRFLYGLWRSLVMTTERTKTIYLKLGLGNQYGLGLGPDSGPYA